MNLEFCDTGLYACYLSTCIAFGMFAVAYNMLIVVVKKHQLKINKKKFSYLSALYLNIYAIIFFRKYNFLMHLVKGR